MSSLITLGIIHAYLEKEGLSSKLNSGVYDGKVVVHIDQNGFSRITSSFTAESMWLDFSKVPKAILMVKKRVLDSLPGDCSKYYGEIDYFFNDIYNYESVYYDKVQKDVFGVFYSKETGRLSLLDAMFEPNFDTNKAFYRLIKLEMSMGLPGTFFIGINAKGNMMGVTIKQKLERMEGVLTQRHIIDAMILALAPGLLGLVSLPPEFINRIVTIANAPVTQG